MSHLDEGTLQALLDGELAQAEKRQIQAHLDRCAACGTRLDDVKNVRSEADRLIVSLGSVDVTTTAPPAPPLADTSSGPLLLILDQPDSELRRERRNRMVTWAAMLFAAVGVGYLAIDIRDHQQLAALAASEAERSGPASEPARSPESPPVLSPTESMGPDSISTVMTSPSDQPPSADAMDDVAAAAESREPSVPTRDDAPRPQTLQAEAAAELAKLEKARGGAAQAQAQNGKPLSGRAARELRSAAATADIDRARREADRQRAERLAAESRAAAERAAAAAARDVPVPAPTPVPPPPSLEQRAQISSRIGLDEAKRYLGTPMHVIEGMTPAFVGLAQGRMAAGMDSTRPVVRAVYLNPSNQLIMLDQQRLRPGQSSGVATQLRLVIDDVIVRLHGEPSANVLRNLATRIQ